MPNLEKGTTLIEASAGTGKTYTLCRIALRLTLQYSITLDRILAVTFTEAATEELASRMRELYQNCLHQLETAKLEETLLKEISEQDGFDASRAKNALRYSLEVFDEAPISTIHGFCKRSLELIALEAQTPLDAELNQVEDELITQLQSEYVRQNVLEASTALSAAFSSRSNFEKLLSELGKQSAAHPDAQLRPVPAPIDITELDRRFDALPKKLEELIIHSDELTGQLAKGRRPTKLLTGQNPALRIAVTRGLLLAQDLDWIPALTSSEWENARTKNHKGSPFPAAVQDVDRILDDIDKAYASLVFNYRRWLSERLAAAKDQANTISFNDLLHMLARALSRDQDGQLATYLSSRYDAALIDEFQDTDRTQLQIIQRLFGNGGHFLFYIGDPKQAIYRFRGADIYAYFQATQGGDLRRIPLSENHRSMPKLVLGVNHLFENARSGFVDERILFSRVSPARTDSSPSSDHPPFRILQLQPIRIDNPPGKGDYRSTLAQRAANDFAERLNTDANLKPEDVTFLVNDRLEANELSDALSQRGIASAILADRSIFQTKEASDLKQVIAALANPSRGSLKRGAYLRLNPSLTAAAAVGESFDVEATLFFDFIVEWARDWFAFNFDVAFNRLLRLGRDSRRSRGLDTERRHANFAQLAELLSEARDADSLSPRGLYNWLARKETANVSQKEEWQTRISSDFGKPQILTIHKSKGLQFPIVVLPFVGLRRVRQKEVAATYHGPDDELIIDFAPDDTSPALERSRREALAEDVRLLYVAFTRAERENLVYLCPEEISKRSELPCSSFAQFLMNNGGATSSSELADCLQSLAASSNGCVGFEKIAYAPEAFVRLKPRETSPAAAVSSRKLSSRERLPGPERVLSFSALSKSMHHDSDTVAIVADEQEAANDESSAPEADPEPPREETGISIFTLPKGTRAGDLLHLILERYDFSKPETLAATTQQAFEALRFEPREFEPIVAAQIDAIARIDLPSSFGVFRLEQVKPAQRIPELEFAYPVSGDIKSKVIDALETNDLGAIPRSWVDRIASNEQGLSASMLRGFVDLILEHEGRLYIFDWKSNYLGPTPESYDQAAMLESMSDHNYFLQYLLYCVALKRYLSWRFPGDSFEDRFGGVFYLYARGITPGKSSGIYYDLPSPQLLDRLDQSLR